MGHTGLNPFLTPEYRSNLCYLAHQAIRDESDRTGYDYLIGRGISDESIDLFKIGYCPESANVPGFSGMIIVPYYDTYDNLIAVTARHILNKDIKPAWWHESFDKSLYLFGMNDARESIIKQNMGIVVEGQADRIMMRQYGFRNTVSPCGSTFSMNQLWEMIRYCDNICFMLDIDINGAGQEAVESIIKKMKFIGDNQISPVNIFRAYLPVGVDPDKYLVENGAGKMKQLIEESYSRNSLSIEDIEKLIDS